MWRWVGVIFIVVASVYQWRQGRPVEHGPGVLVSESPYQNPVPNGEAFSFHGFALTPVAEFSLRARVLSREDYRSGREADLSPVDLALGWGPMSDSSVLEQVRISQRNRFYYWRVDQFLIPRREIETNSANMHLIPSGADVADQLKDVVAGSIVQISGYLVNVKADDGWYWNSSLSRNDTGDGACELIWVERLYVESPASGQ
ncbi:hypothetical protein [Kistimonas asteriae]|uniref:hypothetical protein n=1 Tax=Kistimonas asteriae TaxID=517724 RepID=UPI001BA998C5|nr:hypothetical protein [Kistimonas asteriae]